jgi:hypothetical protein
MVSLISLAGAVQSAPQPFVNSDLFRILSAAITSAVLIALTWWTTVKGKAPVKENLGVFVGFFGFFAIVAGAFFVAAATWNWPAVLLAAGGCLGTGFTFGLLFGYPMSDSPANSNAGAGGGAAAGGGANPPAAPAPATPAKDGASGSTLLKQSVDTLGKLVAGATLVQFQQVVSAFRTVSLSISRCASGSGGTQASIVLGAGVTLYFLVLGFLIGLLLLPLYHLNVPGADEDDSGAGDGK